jgi:hypothetical protein
VVVDARRQTIEHCLDPGRPFTFLEDRLVAGDSLLGVHYLESVHSDEAGAGGRHFAEQARQLVDQLTRERLASTAISSVGLPALQVKRERLRRSTGIRGGCGGWET